jgi:hypothetical protein
MKSMTGILGILLIVFGLLALGYQGITYTQREKVAQIGSLQITADNQKSIYFPPILGGASLAAGIILLIASRKRNK